MTTIRSAPPPMIPPRQSPVGQASDARAAFFRAIAPPQGAAPPPLAQAPAPQARAQAAVQAPQPAQAQPQPPARLLRPGSIIDIKV